MRKTNKMTMIPSLLTLILLIPPSLLPTISAFSPTVSYFLSCGSSTIASLPTDNPPRSFVPDTPFLSSPSPSISLSDSSSSSSSSLYSTARLFTTPASYSFNTAAAKGTYILRLHFLPFSTPSHNLSTAAFDVSACGFALLTNFSLSSPTPALIKEYLLSVDTDQLTLAFTPISASAFVNAIEVFTAPTNLIDGASPTYVGGSHGPTLSQGKQTLYRVNVGGPLVTPANDTLWRTWVPDDSFMYGSALSFKNGTSGLIRYRRSDPRRTPEIAPVSVYSTARSMAVTPALVASNPFFDFNLTWSFRVPPARAHFVRMHFCDFLFSPVDQLLFNVYVGRSLACADVQPSAYTDAAPAAAFYLDFVADSDEFGLLNVSIGRSNRSTATTANAILNGLEIMKLGLDSEAVTADHNRNDVPMKILIPSVIGAVFVLLMSIVIAYVLMRRRRRQQAKPSPASSSWSPYRPEHSAAAASSKSSTALFKGMNNFDLQIPFEEIAFATDNFDNKLEIGSGGFGKVYRGVLRDGTKVAVKRGMPGSRQGYPEFQTEIEVLSRIRHRHLVSLIGYCDDRSEMILVYEYMEKGPLKNHLYGGSEDSLSPCLTWKQRLDICIGAARGLHYLHTGYSHNIIHRDIKSTNILLGEDYSAKVADFGLSRVGPSFGETHVSTVVKGTFGYLDPEYFKIQKLTDKSDVYSFGVTLFEVLCARPVIDSMQSREQLNLAEWALIWQRRGRLEKIVDPRLIGEINENSMRKFGEIAAKCLAEYGVDRPTMGDVLWNLEYALQLQETEVRREPHEDSGVHAVDSQQGVGMMRIMPSSVVMVDVGVDEESEEGRGMIVEGPSAVGASESTVFSQLFAGDGR